MNAETIENPGIVMESNTVNTENTDIADRIIHIEACMVSIRAASWLTAIGILALVVTQVV
jgi:hypothetical protein